MHRLQELVRLHRMGTGCREAARLLGMSPNTEREYREALAAAGLLEGNVDDLPDLEVLRAAVLEQRPLRTPKQQVSSVERWHDEIRSMWPGAGPRAIYDRLRLEHEDFTGTLSAVKRACVRLRLERGVRAEDVAIHVETAPGEVAQVDFGYAGELFDPVEGRERRAWFFVMVLGHSRHMYTRIVFDQRTETWLRLHVEAFEDFGGVPATIVPDNLKAAVIRAAFGVDDEVGLNRSYRELARHCGFRVDPTPPRDPDKKGKVESGVKYVKNNFFKARREERDVSVLAPQLERWRLEIAGMRVHGTTQRRPLEVFEAVERQTLRPLPSRRFEPVVWKRATVHRDVHVVFDRAYYSAPWRLVGRDVFVRAAGRTVMIFVDDVRVATHERAAPGQWRTLDEHLPEGRSDYRQRSRTYWEERADAIGPEVGAYVREIFESDEVLHQLRVVQSVVRHLEGFPPERARAAAARARFYSNYTYGSVKRILRDALDLEPLPLASVPVTLWANAPRFARDVRDLFHATEVNDEPN